MPAYVRRGDAAPGPRVIADTATHVTIAFEISKDALQGHVPFLEMLLDLAETQPPAPTGSVL